MEIIEARQLAHDIMAEYLTGWSFSFDQAKRRFGCCKYRTNTITLSAPLVRLNNRADVEDTIRHEVAHAIAGHQAGHGRLWKEACSVTGANPSRCYDSDVNTPVAPWRCECPNGCFSVTRHRRGKNLYCGTCYKRTGERVPARFVRNTDLAQAS